MATNKRNLVMVIGAGRFGSDVASMLCKKHNETVRIVDKDENAFGNLDGFSGYESCFDALDQNDLIDNGINNTKTIVLATSNDDINIYLADVCYHIFEVPSVYVRLKDSRKAKLLDKNINVICPFDLTIRDFDEKYEG